MRIGVLGPLEVVSDGRDVPVGGTRVRALVARLALDVGDVVSSRALAEALWPDEGPERPVAALHSLVSRLRRAFPVADVLRSEPAGYRLDLPADAVDAVRFERLARDGRRALRNGDRDSAVEQLTRALELWRGEPLADVAHLPYAAAATVRLEELRLGAVEDRIEAELAGPGADPAASVVELERLVATHPLRERLRGLLITALDTDGRRTEALAAYAAYRDLLAEELGTDPGPELRRLHLRVLRAEPERERERARGNLRAALTSFVGRESEQRRLGDQLRDGRLVTLVGPGGVGKTRLATGTAPAVADTVWLVDLAPTVDPDDVPHAVAGTLGLRVSTDVVTRLVEALAATETLLVMDGCEHVVDAVAHLVEELLGRCPSLRILATSREPLGITAERLCPVPPLEPGPAERLFADRARAVQPGFAHADHADTVARICRRLDGLPLAIELAAARLRSMPLDTLAERLDDRFPLLSSGSRTALPRHRTLRGVVAWSWDLLDDAERDAAERVAVFPASFTAEAAGHLGVTEETLHSLAGKSLLVAEGGRYRMLDTIREYGRDRLAETDRLDGARAAHAGYYLALAEQAEPHLRGAEQIPWLARLTAERDHLRAALSHARETGDATTAVRLGAALGMFWTVHGDHAESARQLRAVLETPGPTPEETRLRAAAAYLVNAMFAGDLDTADAAVGRPVDGDGSTSAFVRAMLALATGGTAAGVRALDPHLADPDPWTRAMLWLARAMLHGTAGATEEGRCDLVRAEAGFREAGERWGLSLTLMSLAASRTMAGGADPAGTVALLEEAEQLTRDLGTHDGTRAWLAMVRIDAGDLAGARARLLDMVGAASPLSARQVALARVCLADLARHDGAPAEARRQLDLVDHVDDPPDRALYAAAAGFLAVATGDTDGAARLLGEALALAIGLPDAPMVAHVAVGIADLLLRRGDPDGAAELLGAAHALRGGPNPRNPDVARLRRELHAHWAAYERGCGLDHAGALAAVRGAAAPSG